MKNSINNKDTTNEPEISKFNPHIWKLSRKIIKFCLKNLILNYKYLKEIQ